MRRLPGLGRILLFLLYIVAGFTVKGTQRRRKYLPADLQTASCNLPFGWLCHSNSFPTNLSLPHPCGRRFAIPLTASPGYFSDSSIIHFALRQAALTTVRTEATSLNRQRRLLHKYRRPVLCPKAVKVVFANNSASMLNDKTR